MSGLDREYFENMFRVGMNYEDRLGQLYENEDEHELERGDVPEDIEALEDADLVDCYGGNVEEDNLPLYAEVTILGEAVLGKNVLDQRAEDAEAFADHMTAVEERISGQYARG